MFEDFFKSTREEETKATATTKLKKPPETRQEWMKDNQLYTWPINTEGNITLDQQMENFSDIEKEFMEHAPWDDSILENVSKQLSTLEEKLSKLMEKFLYDRDKQRESASENGGVKITNEASTEIFCNSDLMDAMRKEHAVKNREMSDIDDHQTAIVNERDIVKSTGDLPANMAPLLPNKLEPLPILDTVTKLQQFKANFLKPWRKIFFSDTSCSILQCAFWWIWMEYFRPNKDQQAHLFTLMADRYCSLIVNTDLITKDEIFQYYPECLSQAVFSVFCRAYPKSAKHFHKEDFLKLICNNIHEWVTGIPCPVSCWETWSLKDLDPYYKIETAESDNDVKAIETMRDFERNIRRDTIYITSTQISKRATSAVNKKKKALANESGAEFECVRFATTSKSPLLQHHMLLHDLEDKSTLIGNKTIMNRTQIKEILPVSSFSQLVKESEELSDKRYKEYERQIKLYQKQLNDTLAEHKIEKRNLRRDTRKLLDQRHEITIQAERVMAKYNTPQSFKVSDETITKR